MRLVWAALWARRSQSLVVLALTALAVGIAAAAPWYFFAAGEAGTGNYLAQAPERERAVRLAVAPRQPGAPAVPVAQVAQLVDRAFAGMHEPPVASLAVPVRFSHLGLASAAVLASQGEVCRHVIIVAGACPGEGQVMLSQRTAAAFGYEQGDSVGLALNQGKSSVRLPIAGLYRPARISDPYWARTWDQSASADLLFTDESTITKLAKVVVTTTLDFRLTLAAYTVDLPDRLDLLTEDPLASGWSVSVDTDAKKLADRAVADQRVLSSGIIVATVRFVLLAWFALLIVVWHTAAGRRPDIGLTKLRGVRPWRAWFVALTGTILLVVVGTVVGAVAGVLAVRVGIGPIVLEEEVRLAATQSAMLIGVVLAAVLILAVVAELGVLRLTVTQLLRRVPPKRPRGRAVDVVELVFVLLAAIGIWQLTTVDSAGYGTALAAIGYALIAIVVGLLSARLVTRLGSALGSWGLRTGRLVIALAGITARRRPAVRWVVTLNVVAVAGLALAAGETLRADQAAAARASQQVGAARVLTVVAPSRSMLRDAVHAVDPGGTRAMAVSRVPVSVGFAPTLLAVEFDRLPAVARWLPEYGRLPSPRNDTTSGSSPLYLADGVATLSATEDGVLRPGGTAGNDLEVRPGTRTAPPEGRPVSATVFVQATLITPEDRHVTIFWGPLRPGRHDYRVSISGCGERCRLAALGLVNRPAGRNSQQTALPDWGTRVHLHQIALADRVAVPTRRFADRVAWTSTTNPDTAGLVLLGESTGLAVTMPPGCGGERPRGTCVPNIYPVVHPLHAMVRGSVAYTGRAARAMLVVPRGNATPVDSLTTARALPRLAGDGAMVDLTAFDAAAGGSVPHERLEVWLAEPGDTEIAVRLEQLGVTVMREETIEGSRAAFDRFGPGAVRRYQLWLFGFGVVIAAIALLLAAGVEREQRADELAALRLQGLTMSVVRRIAVIGYGWPALVGVAAGLAVAVSASRLPVTVPEIFIDRWRLVPPPPAYVSLSALGVAALTASVVMTASVLYAARRLTRGVITNPRGSR